MKVLELFKIAISSIRSNKMRSLLTMLGLIIGISSVVTIMSIGEGTSNSISSSLGSLGGNNITISESTTETLLPNDHLTIEDVEALKNAFPDLISGISPKVSGQALLQADLEDNKTLLTGATEDTQSMDDLDLISGRFINDNDILTRKKVAVIDSELASNLFGTQSALGQTLPLDMGGQTSSATIIGVYQKESTSLGATMSEVFLPYSTIDQLYNLKGEIEGIKINLTKGDALAYDTSKLINFLERTHRNEGLEKYEYFSMESMLETVNSTLGTVTLLVSAVAAISLIVGGIGVMNIMLVSVTERTREIGVRKSLGAKRKDILMQFLVESVIICIIGGLIGVLFGFIFTEISAILFKTEMSVTPFSVALSTLFSTAMGVIFGVYPANKASKLDPIEALRYE